MRNSRLFTQLLDKLRQRRNRRSLMQKLDYAEVEQGNRAGDGCGGSRRRMRRYSALDLDAPPVLVGSRPIDESCAASAATTSMAGPVSIRRTLYRVAGKRNAETVDAVSLRAGGGRWLAAGDGGGDGDGSVSGLPSREAEAASERWQRLPYSRCAFERVAHLVKQYGSKREEVERALVETMEIPDGAHAIGVSLIASAFRWKSRGKKGQRKSEKESERVRKGVPKGARKEPKGVRRGRQRCAPFNAYFAWRMRRP